MIRQEKDWWVDENNNKWNAVRYSKERAEQAALINCKDCIDCFSCVECIKCVNCTHCYKCVECIKCDFCKAVVKGKDTKFSHHCNDVINVIYSSQIHSCRFVQHSYDVKGSDEVNFAYAINKCDDIWYSKGIDYSSRVEFCRDVTKSADRDHARGSGVFLSVPNVGSRHDTLQCSIEEDKVTLRTGCFEGDLAAFKKVVEERSSLTVKSSYNKITDLVESIQNAYRNGF